MRWLLMIMFMAFAILTTSMLFMPPATALAAGCPVGWEIIGILQGTPPDHNGDGYVCVGPPELHKWGPPEKLTIIIDNNVPVRAK